MLRTQYKSVILMCVADIVYLPKHRVYQALKISYLAGQNYILKGILTPDAVIQDGNTLNPIFRAERLGELRAAVEKFRSAKGYKGSRKVAEAKL